MDYCVIQYCGGKVSSSLPVMQRPQIVSDSCILLCPSYVIQWKYAFCKYESDQWSNSLIPLNVLIAKLLLNLC